LTSVCGTLFAGTTVKRSVTAGSQVSKNGELLSAAETAGFDVLVTADQSIPDQQNFVNKRIVLIILSAPTNRLRDLLRLIPAALAVLNAIRPGPVMRVS
jgi:alkanesulfonate monooxygenase SsuD/methylene tetrahydromethanopterin reductase-like flavin-dependent oxidoreductase (luciferase family)